MKKFTFSIIIPYKGRYEYVDEAISSVLNQQFDKNLVQVIAVNDPTGEEITEKKLRKKYPDVKYVNNKDLEGPGGKRNTGLLYATGKYVIFLDSDDQLKSNYLKTMLNVLEKEKDLGAAVCFSTKLYSGSFPFFEKIVRQFLSFLQDPGFMYSYLFNGGSLLPSAFYFCQVSHMCFRRSDIESIKFNYDFRKGGEDWDFVFRLLQKKKIKIIPKRLLIFRYSLASSTYTKENIIAKWNSYLLLASRLPRKIKGTLFYKLFLLYVKSFRGMYTK